MALLLIFDLKELESYYIGHMVCYSRTETNCFMRIILELNYRYTVCITIVHSGIKLPFMFDYLKKNKNSLFRI